VILLPTPMLPITPVRIDKKASREEKCKDRAEKEETIRVF
jgi:hypothetical protein